LTEIKEDIKIEYYVQKQLAAASEGLAATAAAAASYERACSSALQA
jgi:hypothetical protein